MKTPNNRIAYVQFSPNGRSYPLLCVREDLGVNDHVEVLMNADTEKAYYNDGWITAIEYHRWACRSHVVNHIEEVDYSIDDTNGFAFVRHVDLTKRKPKPVEEWKRAKAPYVASLPRSARDEMLEIYDAVEGAEGEDAYLGDGMWIKSDGSLEDRG